MKFQLPAEFRHRFASQPASHKLQPLVHRHDMVGGYGLNGYILRNGTFQTIDFPGAIATLPLAVNDDGTIVGIAVDTKGVFHGFKAVPQ